MKNQLRQMYKLVLQKQATEFQNDPTLQTHYLEQVLKQLTPLIQSLKIIGVYCSLPNELPCTELGTMIENMNLRIALPIHQKKEETLLLKFGLYKQGEEFIESYYGIKVPKIQELVIPDLVIVPLFVFDQITLQRIGYGGGYYDKTIQTYRQQKFQTKFVGLATEQLKHQIMDPSDHDQALDYVITDFKCYS